MPRDLGVGCGGKNELANTALVLVDIQNEFVHPAGRFSIDGFTGMDTDAIFRAFIERVNVLASAFRARGLPVFHVITEVRKDYADSALAPIWKSFGFSADGGLVTPRTWGVSIPDELDVQSEDFVVVKKGHSAFRGTTLDRTLRSLGCSNIVLGGGAIGGCLADTAVDGAALGYRQALASDASFSLQRADGLTADSTVDIVQSNDLLTGGWWAQLDRSPELPCAVVVLDSDARVLGPNGVARRVGATADHVLRSSAAIERVVGEALTEGWPVIRVATVVANPALASFPRTADGERDAALFIAAGGLDETTAPAISVVKSGLSAFAGTPLDRILRNFGVTRVVVAGGDCRDGRSVVATVREGAALGYELFVVGDTTYPTPTTSLGDADRRCTVVEVSTWQQAVASGQSAASLRQSANSDSMRS